MDHEKLSQQFSKTIDQASETFGTDLSTSRPEISLPGGMRLPALGRTVISHDLPNSPAHATSGPSLTVFVPHESGHLVQVSMYPESKTRGMFSFPAGSVRAAAGEGFTSSGNASPEEHWEKHLSGWSSLPEVSDYDRSVNQNEYIPEFLKREPFMLAEYLHRGNSASSYKFDPASRSIVSKWDWNG